VANPPCQYDADGSVLRGMGARLLAFWHHCYGTDGGGGAVAQLAAEARRTLHHLTAVPLLGDTAPSGWLAHLFKGQCALSAALSVQTFMDLQVRTLQLTLHYAPSRGFELSRFVRAWAHLLPGARCAGGQAADASGPSGSIAIRHGGCAAGE
jgi:hypothetical protein